jgi:hypothetical protein
MAAMTGTGGNINTQNALANNLMGAGEQATQQSQMLQGMSQGTLAPYLAQQTALASGNRNAATAAAMPTITQLTGGFNAAQAQIMNNMPAGAGRDSALATLAAQRATTTGGAEASAVQQAPQNLFSAGSAIQNMSLQQLGAALAGYQGASSANQAAAQMQAAKSSALWTPFMNIAGDIFANPSIFQAMGGSGSGGGPGWQGQPTAADTGLGG